MPREGLQAGSVPLKKAAELEPAGLRCTASKSTIQESSYRSCWQSPSHFCTRVSLNLRGGFSRVMQVGRKGLGGNMASGSTFEILEPKKIHPKLLFSLTSLARLLGSLDPECRGNKADEGYRLKRGESPTRRLRVCPYSSGRCGVQPRRP